MQFSCSVLLLRGLDIGSMRDSAKGIHPMIRQAKLLRHADLADRRRGRENISHAPILYESTRRPAVETTVPLDHGWWGADAGTGRFQNPSELELLCEPLYRHLRTSQVRHCGRGGLPQRGSLHTGHEKEGRRRTRPLPGDRTGGDGDSCLGTVDTACWSDVHRLLEASHLPF